MTYLEQAIKLAIKGGHAPRHTIYGPLSNFRTVQDPLFWKALGRAKGWTEFNNMPSDYDEWVQKALRYFELKLTGGDEENVWKEIL